MLYEDLIEDRAIVAQRKIREMAVSARRSLGQRFRYIKADMEKRRLDSALRKGKK